MKETPCCPRYMHIVKKDMKITIFLFITFLSQALSHADYFTTYLWYRAEPDLSRIVITDEMIRGHRAVDGFKDKAKEYEKEGKYLTRWYNHKPLVKEVTRIEKMDGHEIKTELVIYPPRGNGFGGACPICSVRVFFDGELKLDCPMGYSAMYSLSVEKVVVNVDDQSLFVSCHNDSGEVLSLYSFFKHDKETIVLKEGKLASKPIDTKATQKIRRYAK
ncbi:MAG: hypothetical protein GY899_05400 [Verrucomicrobiaceae bacterium]|nr:hypothetical protein [Verrucomicrobiaceae bacterium]